MSKRPIESMMEVSAFDPVARDDPHHRLKTVREECPVFRDEAIKTTMLTRYEDIRGIVNDRSLWRHPKHTEEGAMARHLVDDDAEEDRPGSILFMDEPDHSRVRLPLAKAFYARINAKKAELEAIVDEVIDSAPASGEFDLMTEIAVPVPILIIARILGVEAGRVDEFREWSEGVILSLNPVRTPEETAKLEWGGNALDAYFTELMALRREAPQDDLISDMVQLQAAGEADMTDEELRIQLQSLLVGGNLTTTDLIGNGVWLFLTHPDQLAALKADATLAGPAVEEVLRYESPVGATSRVMSDHRSVGGCPMSPHQSIFVSLHAGNRDPNTFEAPDVFDITKKNPSHIAFGGGSHICIGAPLARIEARRAFVRLFERYPNMTLPEQTLEWRALPFFRGLEKL
ncbi:MAG: cytochrome P450, partial [Pseudomonadota bacterium]